MKKGQKYKPRNTKNPFYFLPYPTFIIKILRDKKLFFKCLVCPKVFPTKYRLSRHLRRSKCLRTKAYFAKVKKESSKSAIKTNFTFNCSSLDFYDEKFKIKKKEMSNFCFNESINYNNTTQQIKLIKNSNLSLFDNDSLKNFIFDKENNIVGEGNFGKVYCAKHKKFKSLFAIKEMKRDLDKFDKELTLLNKLKGIDGVPNIINIIQAKNKKMAIQNLCGPSLDKLHLLCNNKFSEPTILEIGISLFSIFKSIHTRGVIHRDIKPANICYGIFQEKNQGFNKSINVIDFGLGKKFDKKLLNESTSTKLLGHFVGTMTFASTSALKGIEQTPKDDLESIFYALVYFKNGSLPWMKFMNKNKREYLMEILKMHKNIKPEELLKGFSNQVIFLYKTIKNLSPSDIPDYDIYIQIFKNAEKEIVKKNKNKEDFRYDWEKEIEKIYKQYTNLEVKRQELLKVSFLKRGYQLNLDEFMKLFI